MKYDLVQPSLSADAPPRDDSRLDVEDSVRQRYSAASRDVEPALCCPVQYEPRYLEVLPQELIERDYGCGDPSRWVQPGDAVLDLGSGGGKICYIASQIVGPSGRVVGIDMNHEMLDLARRYQREIGDRIGWHNVEFFQGRIQDLALDSRRLVSYLADHPVQSLDDWNRAQAWVAHTCREEPLVASDSIDVVLSNCVLNLVDPLDRRQLFGEIFRVLRKGGRAVISDIVCDEPVPERLQNDPHLWSGCISGAYLETEFLQRFQQAGFHGIEIVDRPAEPWATVEGIEFRSLTVRAFKGDTGPGLDRQQAVIYRGPWSSVTDDFGRVLHRGLRTAVSDAEFDRFTATPYAAAVLAVAPHSPPADARPFDPRQVIRDPQQTKGSPATRTQLPTQLPTTDCCGGGPC